MSQSQSQRVFEPSPLRAAGGAPSAAGSTLPAGRGRPALRVAMFNRRPSQQHGGVEHVVRAVTHELAAQRPDWEIIPVAAFSHTGGVESINGVSDLVATVVLAWRLLRGRFDVVFVHCPECMSVMQLLRRFVLRQVRLVAVWHGAGPLPYLVLRSPGDPLARALAWFRCSEERRALPADAHIAVHESVVRDLRRYYGFTDAVTVVENAIEPDMLRKLQQASPARGADCYTVLWVGQAAHRKGLDVALESCRIARATVPQLRLVVVGLPPRQGPDWVVWRGVLDPTEVHMPYRDADVFLFPSRYESFGLVVVEAMAAGLPVVVSDAVPTGIVQAGRNGVVIAGHRPEEYATALVDLWRARDARARMSETNRGDAGRFSWPVAAQRYAAVALQVTEGGSRA